MADIVFKSKDSMMNLVNLVNEAADAVGKVFGSGKGTGVFVLAAPVVALITSGVITHLDDKQKKQLQAEKERLQKEAIIQVLKQEAQESCERQDYLEKLNHQLQVALADFQKEAAQNGQV